MPYEGAQTKRFACFWVTCYKPYATIRYMNKLKNDANATNNEMRTFLIWQSNPLWYMEKF